MLKKYDFVHRLVHTPKNACLLTLKCAFCGNRIPEAGSKVCNGQCDIDDYCCQEEPFLTCGSKANMVVLMSKRIRMKYVPYMYHTDICCQDDVCQFAYDSFECLKQGGIVNRDTVCPAGVCRDDLCCENNSVEKTCDDGFNHNHCKGREYNS